VSAVQSADTACGSLGEYGTDVEIKKGADAQMTAMTVLQREANQSKKDVKKHKNAINALVKPAQE